MREVFAAGTAAVITPITSFRGDGFEVSVGDGSVGSMAEEIKEHLVGIQTGRREDTRGWLHKVGEI